MKLWDRSMKLREYNQDTTLLPKHTVWRGHCHVVKECGSHIIFQSVCEPVSETDCRQRLRQIRSWRPLRCVLSHNKRKPISTSYYLLGEILVENCSKKGKINYNPLIIRGLILR